MVVDDRAGDFRQRLAGSASGSRQAARRLAGSCWIASRHSGALAEGTWMIYWPGFGSVCSFCSAIISSAWPAKKRLPSRVSTIVPKLADDRDPALAAGTPDQQLLFGFRRFEDDVDRTKAVDDGVDDGPDMRAAFGDDDDVRLLGFHGSQPVKMQPMPGPGARYAGAARVNPW